MTLKTLPDQQSPPEELEEKGKPKQKKEMTDKQRIKDKVERLYIKYEIPLLKLSMKLLKNKPDSEDAVHDTFVKVLENPEKVGDEDDPQTRAYLITITRNNCLNIIRERKKNIISLEELRDSPEAATLSLEDEYFENDLTGTLFDRVGEKYKTVLLMRYQSKMTPEEISEALGLNYWAVIKRLERAEKLLHDICLEEGRIRE